MFVVEAALITAAAVTAAYYAPFIIATTVAVVGSISTAIAGYYVGKAKTSQESEELKELRKELIKREQRVRKAASRLAEQTAGDVEHLLKQSKKHRKQMGNDVQKLHKRVVQMDSLAEYLDNTQITFDEVTHGATLQVDAMEQEIDSLKTELKSLNLKLRGAQKSLQDREQELNDTLDKLHATQEALDDATQKGTDKIIELTEQLSEIQALLHPGDTDLAIKDAELGVLQEENARMSKSIHTLKATIDRAALKVDEVSETNRSQIDEIKTLHSENKRLNKAIKSLATALENQSTHTIDSQSNHPKRGHRMF